MIESNFAVPRSTFIASTLAYQGAGHGASQEAILELHERFVGIRPDLTIVLDVDPAIGLKRAASRNSDTASSEHRFEDLDLAFHERVRAGMIYAAAETSEKFAVFDANVSADEVFANVLVAIKPFIDEYKARQIHTAGTSKA